ncbi:hypothetical protein [Mesorhizobium sp. M1396]|uniref:hypothetical protein n=1 Tax=Mesorhizobium sp. M1396 TaxID=2957095 RepID=UPI0033367EEC
MLEQEGLVSHGEAQRGRVGPPTKKRRSPRLDRPRRARAHADLDQRRSVRSVDGIVDLPDGRRLGVHAPPHRAIPKVWKGQWTIHEKTRKLYILHVEVRVRLEQTLLVV